MSIQQLLQQILQSGQTLAQDAGGKLNQSAPGLTSKLGGFGGGALTGGALALLLGNKKFRKLGGGLASYGGAAALGALALKTYQDWQQKSAEQAWFNAQLARPADPAETAALATTPEQAAEVYLASLLVIDEQSYMERAYLDELARQMPLPEGLKQELEEKVRSLA